MNGRTMLVMVALLLAVGAVCGQTQLDIEQVIAQACRRDSLNRADVHDLVMSAESYGRTLRGDGTIKEEKLFFKTYYFKDSLFRTEFHQYYLNGQLQGAEELQKQVKEDEKRRKEDHNRDASVIPVELFYPRNRQHYIYSMPGIEVRQGYTCYHVKAECLEESENLLEGDFWFEVDDFNLVEADFHPARLPTTIRKLNMTMVYGPAVTGYWLPMSFCLEGRGKALLVIKFNFEVEEKYTRHKINVGLTDDYFSEDANED